MAEYYLSILDHYDMSSQDVLWLSICGFLVGANKSGVKGMSNMAIPLMAHIFGAKSSTGILLLILIIADTGAVFYYRKSTDWSHLKILLPSAFVGVLLATWVGNALNEEVFKNLMAVLILLSLIVLLLRDHMSTARVDSHRSAVGQTLGLSAGFTTMIGNMAGPFIDVYMLLIKLPKMTFIATTAWFFYMINIIKVPFHIFVWKTISLESLIIDVIAIPGIFLGLIAGVYIVKLMDEVFFRKLVIITTALAAIMLLF